MSLCVGVANKARRVTQLYVGVNGKARHVKKVYIGVNNKASLVYNSLSQVIKDIPTTPGQVCNWAGYNWTVVHVTTDLIYMILTNIYSLTRFSNGSIAQYSSSNLVTLCNTFLGTIDSKYQAVMADVTVNGVTQKVFVPAHGMVCNDSPNPYSGSNGTNNIKDNTGSYGDGKTAYPCFSWFNAARGTGYANRIARYNGKAYEWWVSTAINRENAWYVYKEGSASIFNSTMYQYGFRPCIAVKRKM